MSAQMEAYIRAIEFKITDGDNFLWKCFGPNARFLESLDGDFHVSAVFDTVTRRIYEASISSTYSGDIGYRWIDMDYIEAYKEEAASRNVDWMQLCDDKRWAMTDDFDDIIDKITKITRGEEYDPRVILYLELDDDVKEMVENAATLLGISIEEFVERALKETIKEEQE